MACLTCNFRLVFVWQPASNKFLFNEFEIKLFYCNPDHSPLFWKVFFAHFRRHYYIDVAMDMLIVDFHRTNLRYFEHICYCLFVVQNELARSAWEFVCLLSSLVFIVALAWSLYTLGYISLDCLYILSIRHNNFAKIYT